MVCLLFPLVLLMGYGPWLWLFQDIFISFLEKVLKQKFYNTKFYNACFDTQW